MISTFLIMAENKVRHVVNIFLQFLHVIVKRLIFCAFCNMWFLPFLNVSDFAVRNFAVLWDYNFNLNKEPAKGYYGLLWIIRQCIYELPVHSTVLINDLFGIFDASPCFYEIHYYCIWFHLCHPSIKILETLMITRNHLSMVYSLRGRIIFIPDWIYKIFLLQN